MVLHIYKDLYESGLVLGTHEILNDYSVFYWGTTLPFSEIFTKL